MIVRKGESVALGSVFKPISGTFDLADYEVKCNLTDLKGKVHLTIDNDNIIRNNDDNTVACTISSAQTSKMKGLYFISFQLWANGEKVLSNEIERITVIG